MESYNVNNLVKFCVVVRKSKKGNEYKALVVQFVDKEDNVLVEKQLDFLTNTQFDNVLSLLKK